MPTRTRSSASLTRPLARSSRNAALNKRSIKPDARGCSTPTCLCLQCQVFPAGLLGADLRCGSACALDDAFACSDRANWRRLDVSPRDGTFHIARTLELDMAHGLASPSSAR